MASRQIQSTFSFGELDERLYSKVDFEGYFKGARLLENMIVTPQGGAARRFGTKFSHVVVDTKTNTPVVDPDKVNICVFEYSPDKTFLIVAQPYDESGVPEVEFRIYLNDVYMPAVQVKTTGYTIAQISELRYLKAHNRVIILHEDEPPRQIVRGATDNDWTISTVNFGWLPTFDFSVIDGLNYRDGTTFTASATTGTGITVTASAAKYTAGHVGGLIYMSGGVMRITAVNAAGTIATGDVMTDFDAVGPHDGKDVLLEEVAWGDSTAGVPPGKDRGWPSRGTFFQFRMVLANSKALTNLLWASASGDLLNFDTVEANDLDSFSIGVGSSGNEEIQDVIGSKGLIALTNSGIYASSLYIDTAMTPGNAFLIEQTRDSAGDFEAQVIDNAILYPGKSDDMINIAVYDIGSSSFNVVDGSVLSPHLVDEPTSTASYFSGSDNGNIYFLTLNDGRLSIFQTVNNQSINGWTWAETRGKFRQVDAVNNTAYFVIKRQVGTPAAIQGSLTNGYTTNEDFEAYTDITSALTTGATNVDIFVNNYDYVLLGNDMPFFKLMVTLATPANADLNPTFEYLDDTGTWTTFTPNDGTAGFTASGNITWTLAPDVDAWFPQDLESITGIALPADTVAYPKKKFWMRMRRNSPGEIDIGFTVDPIFTNFVNISPSLSDAATNANLFTVQNEYLLLGHSEAFSILNVVLNTNSSADILATFEYLDTSNTWVTFVPTADGTTGFTGNGAITWNSAAFVNWGAMSVNGNADKFWIRIRRTEAVVGVIPIEETIFMNITTVPTESTFDINIGDRIYIESSDFDSYMDSTETSNSVAGVVSNLDHLVGHQVYARVDGVPSGPYFVNDSAQITVGDQSVSTAVGLNYIPKLVPMPVVTRGNVYQPKHVKGIYVDYYKSLGITVNGKEIATLSLNNFVLDQTPIAVSGFQEFTPMRGWDPRAENEISQELPLPMTITGIGYRVETS